MSVTKKPFELKFRRELCIICYLQTAGLVAELLIRHISKVSVTDMTKSIADVHDGIPLTDVDFDELVVDEKKTNSIKMFRLAESTNAILVHESLRDILIEKGFGSDMTFYDLKEAAI